jgi:hypothetical protein
MHARSISQKECEKKEERSHFTRDTQRGHLKEVPNLKFHAEMAISPYKPCRIGHGAFGLQDEGTALGLGIFSSHTKRSGFGIGANRALAAIIPHILVVLATVSTVHRR